MRLGLLIKFKSIFKYKTIQSSMMNKYRKNDCRQLFLIMNVINNSPFIIIILNNKIPKIYYKNIYD